MESRGYGRYAPWLLCAAVAAFAACGDSDSGPAPAPTRTATQVVAPTATRTSSPAPAATATATVPVGGAGVQALVVLRDDIGAGAEDALGEPPAGWAAQGDAESFDRALANADWWVAGPAAASGVSGEDGRFEIRGLPPGEYRLQISKTLSGNLIPLTIPFKVGDDGEAELVVQVGLGLARTAITYRDDGVEAREVRGPYGNWSLTRGGRLAALGDWSRVLTDDDGDGRFESGACDGARSVWECPAGGACADGLACTCLASCPRCEDCGALVCAGQPSGHMGPYACGPDDSCAIAGDRCACVSSCPECDDCPRKACVPGCEPVEIAGIDVNGPSQIAAGRTGRVGAAARLTDGSTFDVTYIADWRSADEAVATVDSWGAVSALSIGATSLTAAVGGLTSTPFDLAVVESPALVRITVQNQSCSCWPVLFGAPSRDMMMIPCLLDAARPIDILPVPACNQIIQIGGTIQFAAIGEFADGSFEDITKAATWAVVPPEVGEAAGGLFTGKAEGTARLTAALGGVTSEPTEIQVVAEPTLVSVSIYPNNIAFIAVDGGPIRADAPVPCFDCGTSITVLRGDRIQFRATGRYNTGEWRDLTDQVTWNSSDVAVAEIAAGGSMTAAGAGDAAVDAKLDGIASNTVAVRVVEEATLQSIHIYMEGTDRVVAKGDQRFFHASGYYDIGISRDVTKEAVWKSSDENVGSFDTPGVFTGRGAGMAQVWAELGGKRSESIGIETFETSEIGYCDPERINRAVWFDDFNRVLLESDCDTYRQPGVATVRYTVTETQPHGGIFDPCLDLYVYRGSTRIRTIREEGCGDPFFPAAAPGRDALEVKYQFRAFWDLKDEKGDPVTPGTYSIIGRFFLYYDPIVSIDVTVLNPDGSVPTPAPTTTPVPLPTAGSGGDGACFLGSSYVPSSRDRCCLLYGANAVAMEIAWCDAGGFDPATGKCVAPGHPCEGVAQPSPGATPTPPQVASAEGVCYRGPGLEGCTGSSFPTAREKCCVFARQQMGPVPVTWCPAELLDPAGVCGACGDPC